MVLAVISQKNEVVQGATYPNIEAVKNAMRLWAISLKREFRVVKSGSKEYASSAGNVHISLKLHQVSLHIY